MTNILSGMFFGSELAVKPTSDLQKDFKDSMTHYLVSLPTEVKSEPPKTLAILHA
jgi:hypothetical protein